MKIIETINGKYYYEEKELYYGRKIVDKKNIKENLKKLVSILEKHEIRYCLIYGTLLGAIRENDIISHDEDADIIIFDEYRKKFIDLLFNIKEEGLEVIRYKNDVISLMRNEDYIDIYFFKKKSKIFYWNLYCNSEVFPSKFFRELIKMNCLGYCYYVPRCYTEVLVYCYGDDWKIPKKNSPSTNHTFFNKIRLKLRKIKILYKIYLILKNKKFI
ncbi:LicD family protein [Fusobacterium sp.]|uniref:LicD family protein n=1 Tax=Fusobacterium sp. TaxID=68766 RepID=UPI00260A0494|nr:LicD family protein [Fusobacterium sp.]